MTDFPQYRKYNNDKSFFKITAKDKFEQISFIGQKIDFKEYQAQILPDRNRIMDMIEMRDGFWVQCEAEEFEHLKKKCLKYNS